MCQKQHTRKLDALSRSVECAQSERMIHRIDAAQSDIPELEHFQAGTALTTY